MKQPGEQDYNASNDLNFQKKVWITILISAAVVMLLLFFYAAFSVLLLVLAGSLIAVFFRAVSTKIERITNWKSGICVTISIITTLLILAGLFWLIGAKVQEQTIELSETLPKTISQAKTWLNKSEFGEKILSGAFSETSMKKTQQFASDFFQSTFGVLGDLYVVLFIGIFFTISPQIYIKGFVQLIPVKGQKTAQQVLNKLGEQLRKWLKGTLFSMLTVFVLTAIGLAILGMPLWLVLAVLAGLLSFIPNFGPLLAIIPAVLLAFSESPKMALLVACLYILIQFVESNFITTAIQKKLTNLPPALILIAQLFMGVLTGAWGLVLAIPITLIVIVLVQELYINKRSEPPKKLTAKD